MANRPTAPHLQIWRWGPHMTVSILHRASGTILAIVALPLLLWWLGALASGPEAYATFTQWIWDGEDGNSLQSAANLVAKLALVVTTWALFEHTLSGLRHYVLDMGAQHDKRHHTSKDNQPCQPITGHRHRIRGSVQPTHSLHDVDHEVAKEDLCPSAAST